MASYQPPFQPGNHSNNFNNCNEGRSLLDLLRARDKKLSKQSPQQHHDDADAADDDMLIINDDDNDDQEDDDEITELEEELIQRLQSLNYSIRRRGIFNNDANRANLYYSHASDRGGSLAGGDAAAADNGGGGGSGGGGSKKRKRNKGSGGGSTASSGGGGLSAAAFGIFLESSHNNSNATNASNGNAPYVGISASSGEKNLDEGLLVTVICRILGVTMGRRKKREGGSDAAVLTTKGRPSSFPLICAALNVLSSFCDHAKDGMVSSLFGDSQCASIEAEMMACIGTNVLDALCDNSLLYFQTILAKENNDGKSSCEELQNGLIASLRACASVVSLLETRLSRADKTMNNLRGAAWLILGNLVHLTNNNSNSYGRTTNGESCTVQKAATMLLATLPLAGNSESVPPSKLWSQSIRDGMTLLRWAINDFFPMPSADGRTTTVKDESKSNLKLWNDHQHWASIAKEAPSSEELDLGNDPTDNHRANALLSRIQCLTNYLHSLLTMEGYSLHRANSNLSSTIIPLPFDSILNTSELLLSFPLAAEVKHRSSKPRLRSSPVAGGQISPNAAMSISATMRVCGHTLLDVAIESCRGGSGALGRSHRIVGMAVANLQSSCSLALVSVVDGQRNSGISSSSSSSRAGEGNNSKGARMGWLRGSIPLRIKSIQTFHAVAVSLGSGVMSSAGTAKAVSRGLVLLGGCLLEQVQGEGAEKDGQTLLGSGGGTDEEWGTLGERAKLVETSSTALAACIAAFGGLVPNDVRGTIDSITHSCLSTLYSFGGSSIFVYSHAKRSILQLGMNCVCVPWGDGGRSTIGGIIRSVSMMLRNDPDMSVATVALSTLCAFDALVTPRSPPILMPTRDSINETSISNGLSASSMLRQMNESKRDISDLKDAKEKKNKSSEKKTPKSKKKRSNVEMEENIANNESSSIKEEKGEPTNKKSKHNDGTRKVSKNDVAEIDKKDSNAAIAKYEKLKNEDKGSVEVARNQHVESNANSNSEKIAVDTINAPKDKNDDVDLDEGKSYSNTKAASVKNSDDEDESDFDFPDIVDEEPDEEDRI